MTALSAFFQKGGVYRLTRIAMGGALLCLLSPWSIPLAGGVPVTLGSFAVLFLALLLGAKEGVACTALYLSLGAMGLPVFSGGRGGVGILAGPTGGYLFGFLLLALCAGAFKRSAGQIAGILLGEALLYLLGTVWFILAARAGVWKALSACVFPFLPGDAVKAALAWGLAALFRKRMGAKQS